MSRQSIQDLKQWLQQRSDESVSYVLPRLLPWLDGLTCANGAELRKLIADNAGRSAFLDAHPAASAELAALIEENERLRGQQAQAVPPQRSTDKWESARVADYNAGWNACRDAMLSAAPQQTHGAPNELVEFLAKELFALGSEGEGRQAKRIQFKIGDYPDWERDGGGLNYAAFKRFMANTLFKWYSAAPQAQHDNSIFERGFQAGRAHERQVMAAPQAQPVEAEQVENLRRDYARALDTIQGHAAQIGVLEQHIRELRAFQAMVNRHAPEFPADPDGTRDVWYWQGDGRDHLESMTHQLPVVIRAEQLRELLAAQPAQPVREPMSPAARDVLAERQRQISVDGWTPEHDDEHNHGEMSLAASCYAEQGPEPYGVDYPCIPARWPWDPEWWKPSSYRRNLVKAGALILAEIERLDRAGIGSNGDGNG